MAKTFNLIQAAALLGLEGRDELLFIVASENKPLGYLPHIRNHSPYDIRFTARQIMFIAKKLKNYKPEALDFEKIEKILSKHSNGIGVMCARDGIVIL